MFSSQDGRSLVRGARVALIVVGMTCSPARHLARPTVVTQIFAAPAEHPPVSETPLAPRTERATCVYVNARDDVSDRLLPVRVVLRGVAGTRDPEMDASFRGAGVHNVVVLAGGEGEVPVAPGHYEVTVSHGPEWSIVRERVAVQARRCGEVAARLRHIVPVARWTACDLHVHARPSYDAEVTVQNRVASLVAEGIEFALPSEHNLVGDYTPGVEALPVAAREAAGGHGLVWRPAVEVTTARLGHFNIYPYFPGATPREGLPPLGATPREIFRAGRANNPAAIIQVNHPRMGRMGYFNRVGFNAVRNAGTHGGYDPGYDAIEVFNGFHLGAPARVDGVFREWLTLLANGARYVGTASSDSHTLAYRQAGYPRTYVYTPDRAGGGAPDADALLRALRAGHAFGTSGPMLHATIEDRIPGDTVVAREDAVTLRVRVEAAPWIDVDQVEVYRNGALERVLPVPVTSDVVRFDAAVRLPAARGYVVVVARGDAEMDAVLPTLHARPFAFTNPIWIE